MKLKKENVYSYHLYKCNPIERLAEINSLNKVKEYLSLMNKNNLSYYFELEYLITIIYGYYENEFKYPINIFFNNFIDINYKGYSAEIIGSTISEMDYLDIVNQEKLTEKKLDV